MVRNCFSGTLSFTVDDWVDHNSFVVKLTIVLQLLRCSLELGYHFRCIIRSRMSLNSGACRDFRLGPELGAIRKQPGRGRSWITGLAGISGLGPNSEPRGNNHSFPETCERARVPVKKIGSRDSIFGLVNSTYFFEITNHNQHPFNSKYLANLIKKYWTCFRH